jgi:DNA-binding beta-propeller fold protein YncE
MNGVRRVAVVGVVGLCVLVGGLVFGSVAWGALQYPFLRQLSGLNSPGGGLAVDPVSGDTLVADETEGKPPRLAIVRAFNTSGSLVSTWTGVGTPAGRFNELSIYSLAVNDATGDVYVANQQRGVGLVVLDASGGYVCQITGLGSATTSSSECDSSAPGIPGGGFGEGQPEGVMVDQATGDVYAFDSARQVVDVFSSAGVYLRQLSGASTPVGHFESVSSMAVNDSNGDLLIADGGVVYVFNAVTDAYVETWDGSPASNAPGVPGGSFGQSVSVAADNATGAVYVGDAGGRVVDALSPSGSYLGQITGTSGASPFTRPENVAVDQSTGEVLVLDRASAPVVDVFSGTQVVVPDVTTDTATGVTATAVTLNGAVNPEGVEVKSCHFEYGTSTAYGQSAGCVETVGSGSSEVHVHADVSGLLPGTVYHFRLVAGNENGTEYGEDVEVTTLPVPTIAGTAASNLTSTSVDLAAQVNPNGYDTTYRFEYGTSTAYATSVPVPDGNVGAGSSGVPVTVHLSGLAANTTYHWRVVATSATGTTVSGDQTFIYDTSGGGLPDNRAYEMVTPAQKDGGLIDTLFFGLTPAVAEAGSRVMSSTSQCFGDAGSCVGLRGGVVGTEYEFTRTEAGWVASALSPPATEFDTNTSVAFSADAGTALLGAPTAPAGEDDFYARQAEGSFADIGPIAPPADGAGATEGSSTATGTSDLSRVVYEQRYAGLRWPFDPTSGQATLYEYAGVGNSQPFLVGVSGGAGSTSLISECGTLLGGTDEFNQRFGDLSADGRTVFFTAESCASGSGVNAGVPVPADELYARVDESQTVLVSGRSPVGCTSVACLGSPPGDAEFEGASEDGSKVLFTSTQQLTDSASEDSSQKDTANSVGCSETVGVNGCNLYMYDFGAPAGHELLTVSAGDLSGGGPRVQGVMAISADGSHVYFVAKGVLSAAANEQGQTAQDGADNLYVFERDARYPEGHVAFVTMLAASDAIEEWVTGTDEGGHPANVTPDGRFLVFLSHGRLTADDTSTTGAQQVFRYDALTGALVRISIGERGFDDNGNASRLDAGIVAAFPHLGPIRRDPTMSHDGAFVFFESPAALTPRALNEVPIGIANVTSGVFQQGSPVYAENVYEWHEGQVYLISDGRDVSSVPSDFCVTDSSVCLLGSDATGANVFFTTADSLVPQDTDTQKDIYDARICTAGEPCISAPAPVQVCQGEGCHGTPSPAPSAPGAATILFAGPGNVLASPPVAVKHKPAVKKHARHTSRKRPKRKRAKGRKATGRKATHRGARGGRGGRS